MANFDAEKLSPSADAVHDELQDYGTGKVVVDKKADIGLQFLAQHERVEYSTAEERRIRWKIDLFLLPILSITFGLQYLDKVTLSYAAVYGMREDLGLVGQQYSWCTSLFYFGYLFGQLPANYLLQKLPIGKFAAANLLIWGMLVMCMAASKNFAGVAVIRVLMGIFEACIQPAWTHVTGIWYTGYEQSSRITAWYSLVGIAQIVGGLLSYGIGHIQTGVAQWQLVFLICGGFTVLWSAVVYICIPDSPTSARFLNEREKTIAVERLRANRTGIKNTVFKPAQALEALCDPQVWMFCFWMFLSSVPNIAGSFLPLIIEDLGFTGIQTTLLTLPSGAVEFIAMMVAGGLSLLVENYRTVIMFWITVPTLIGCIFLEHYPESDTWIRAVGCWLLLCAPGAYAVLLSLITSNIAGFSKKVTTTAMVFIMYCVGNIVSPQLFIAKEAPQYHTGIRAVLSCWVLNLTVDVCLGCYYVFENRRRDKALAATPPEVIAATSERDEEFFDRTDKEDFLKFRYRW